MKEMIILICSGLTLIMAFLHLLLLCGVPLGEYVLGGTDRVIPKEKRKLNVIFFCVFTVLGIVYMAQTQYLTLEIPKLIVKIIMILYSLFLGYAIVGNLCFTNSKKEKILMTPLSTIGFITSIASLFIIW